MFKFSSSILYSTYECSYFWASHAWSTHLNMDVREEERVVHYPILTFLKTKYFKIRTKNVPQIFLKSDSFHAN